MDIEKLIEQLRTESLYADKASLKIMDLCMEAATALSTLQAENEEMQKQLNEFSEFLCHMTGGLLSKTNYTAQEMISAAEDYQQNVCGECDLWDENEKLRAELEQVKRCIEIVEKQRDAAIEELEKYMVQDLLDGNEPCGICAKASDTPCEYCDPKWRGQKED